VNEFKEIEKQLKNNKLDIVNLEELIFVRNINISLGADINFDTYRMKNREEIDNFNDKYGIDLTKIELEKLINNKYKNEKNMSNYILKQQRKCEIDKKLFTNENLINNIFNTSYAQIIYFLYQIDFLKIIKTINILIDSLKENIRILPKSLKYISKIISFLIKKKFPDILKIDENIAIIRFLFINLFIPIFKNPYDIYINEIIISENTLYNLGYILDIFSNLLIGNFYESREEQFHFTPFNWFFIEKMPTLFNFFENIIDIKLPIFIDKLINCFSFCLNICLNNIN
jgi:hypothetical protein